MEITLQAKGIPVPQATVYKVPSEVVEGTLAHLRNFGRMGLEAVGYWIGPCEETEAKVAGLWVPHFHATPVSYDVEPSEMLRLKQELDESAYVLLAQVHSHPGSAFHSGRDDIHAASPWPGFISVVVPNGGRVMRPFFAASEVFEHLGKAKWRRLGEKEKHSRFLIL